MYHKLCVLILLYADYNCQINFIKECYEIYSLGIASDLFVDKHLSIPWEVLLDDSNVVWALSHHKTPLTVL